MPQLDHFSFFSQVFWVLFFFVLFYFVNLRYILPALATILKVRKKLLQKSGVGSSGQREENYFTDNHFEFFSLTKNFVSSPLTSHSRILKKSSFVKDCFHRELKKEGPILSAKSKLDLILRAKV